MNKSELVQELAAHASIPNEEAATYVDIVFDSMRKTLQEGGRVEIRDFGTFHMKDYKGYASRNPKTGEPVEVSPKRLPFFRAGTGLKEYINEND